MTIKKILIIEDNFDTCVQTKEVIETKYNAESKKVVVDYALNGVEGIERFLTFIPDLILLDIEMAEMNGKECLKIIKEHRSDAKVIMVTVVESSKTQNACYALGCCDFLMKPVIPQVLLGKIEKYLVVS